MNNSLEIELIDFLKFKSGRPFEQYTKQTEDDWTKLIWSLLKVAKDKVSKRNNAGLKSFSRLTTMHADGLMNHVTDADMDSFFGDLHGNIDYDDHDGDLEAFSDEENGAPSVILIESIETEKSV